MGLYGLNYTEALQVPEETREALIANVGEPLAVRAWFDMLGRRAAADGSMLCALARKVLAGDERALASLQESVQAGMNKLPDSMEG